MNPVAAVLVGMIRAYKFVLSPLLPPACRFEPTCSRYAEDAIRRYGARRGTGLAFRRILRCRPGCEGGYDPVPFDDDEPVPFTNDETVPSNADRAARADDASA